MSEKPKFYITTAIAYTSRKPHIGNSYEIVLTDAIARYKRLQGYDVFFLTGTDEHGQKIEEYAKEAGVSPKEYVDKVSGEIRAICDVLNTTYDKFIRTTDPYHEKIVAKIFKKLYEQGDIYKSEYEGMYCTPCESFWTESQLVDGKCPDCGREVKKAKEEAYFLRLSKYQKQLEDYIESHDDFIYPEARKKEMLNNFIKPGLQDLCVSRTSFKWGIPVTFDPNHVIYVWIDALSNYITALGYDPDQHYALHVIFALLEEECCRASFLLGAFLAGGSVTEPRKRYHLELATPHLQAGREVEALLRDMGYEPKNVQRQGNGVTYFQQSAHIEELLTRIGAPAAAMEVMAAKVEKEMRNTVNRRVNCDAANVDKAVAASREQVEARTRLTDAGIVATLPVKLQEVAVARLLQPELSLSELAETFDPPLTKSCLNHRMRKLMELAGKEKA